MTDLERAAEIVMDTVGPENARFWSVRNLAVAVVRAISAEREACAKIADTAQEDAEHTGDGDARTARSIAAAIRARKGE